MGTGEDAQNNKTETIKQYLEGVSGITQILNSPTFIFHSFYTHHELGEKGTNASLT